MVSCQGCIEAILLCAKRASPGIGNGLACCPAPNAAWFHRVIRLIGVPYRCTAAAGVRGLVTGSSRPDPARQGPAMSLEAVLRRWRGHRLASPLRPHRLRFALPSDRFGNSPGPRSSIVASHKLMPDDAATGSDNGGAASVVFPPPRSGCGCPVLTADIGVMRQSAAGSCAGAFGRRRSNVIARRSVRQRIAPPPLRQGELAGPADGGALSSVGAMGIRHKSFAAGSAPASALSAPPSNVPRSAARQACGRRSAPPSSACGCAACTGIFDEEGCLCALDCGGASTVSAPAICMPPSRFRLRRARRKSL